jgi:phage terminase large subunit-like protein
VHSILWDMATPAHSAIFSETVVRLQDEFDSRNVVWDGHPGLRQHLRNARTFMGKYGMIIRKPGRGSKKKIDAAVCFVGARMLARVVQNKPELEPTGRQAGSVWIPPSYRNRRR